MKPWKTNATDEEAKLIKQLTGEILKISNEFPPNVAFSALFHVVALIIKFCGKSDRIDELIDSIPSGVRYLLSEEENEK